MRQQQSEPGASQQSIVEMHDLFRAKRPAQLGQRRAVGGDRREFLRLRDGAQRGRVFAVTGEPARLTCGGTSRRAARASLPGAAKTGTSPRSAPRLGTRAATSLRVSIALDRNVVSLPPVTVTRPFSSSIRWSRVSLDGSIARREETTGRTPDQVETMSASVSVSAGNS